MFDDAYIYVYMCIRIYVTINSQGIMTVCQYKNFILYFTYFMKTFIRYRENNKIRIQIRSGLIRAEHSK